MSLMDESEKLHVPDSPSGRTLLPRPRRHLVAGFHRPDRALHGRARRIPSISPTGPPQDLLVDNSDPAALQALGRSDASRLADTAPSPCGVSRPLRARGCKPTRADRSPETPTRSTCAAGRPSIPRRPPVCARPHPRGPSSGWSSSSAPSRIDGCEELTAMGLRTVMYMPNNAYVVWGDAAGLGELEASLAKSPFIQVDRSLPAGLPPGAHAANGPGRNGARGRDGAALPDPRPAGFPRQAPGAEQQRLQTAARPSWISPTFRCNFRPARWPPWPPGPTCSTSSRTPRRRSSTRRKGQIVAGNLTTGGRQRRPQRPRLS